MLSLCHYYLIFWQISVMFQYLLTLCLIFAVYLTYTWHIRPYRIIKNYVKLATNLGYSVLEIPYNPIRIDLIATIRKGIREGDALKQFKTVRNNYDIVVCNSLNRPRIEIYNPDFIKDFYSVDKHYEYPKAERVVKIFSRIGGHGLPLSEGNVWARKRKILNKVFNFDFVKSQTDKIAKNCANAIRQLEKQVQINNGVVQYNISDLTVRMFSAIILQSFLGGTSQQIINNEPAGQYLKNLMTSINNQALQPINSILGPDFYQLGITKKQRQIQGKIKIFRQWCLTFIRKRVEKINQDLQGRRSENAGDIIQALLIAQKNDTEKSLEPMISQKEIFEQFTAFFIAGTDTTSNFTQVMIYSIALNPPIQAKVREQIDAYMKTQDYSYENLKKLKYIDMLQKQTTRYYGPGTQLFTRVAKLDNYLNGLPIKKGTAISLMVIGNHFSKKYFKNPQQFRPQRWENECDELPNYVFGGFSAGARTCIGKHLALIESKIALIKFMKRYKKISLAKPNFKMIFKFLYSPEDFNSQMTIINDNFTV